jgi:hypothetical protein
LHLYFSPLAHRGGRVIGTDTIGILLVLHVSSDDQEREQGGEDNPNVNAHSSTLAACPLRAESGHMQRSKKPSYHVNLAPPLPA